MIDFHAHVLPGIDDGSQSLPETEAMLKTAYSQGVSCLAATPHFYADEMELLSFLEKRQQAFGSVCLREEEMPQVLLGAEVAYFDNMSRSDAMHRLQLGNSGLLLVEMPFVPWTDRIVEDVCRLQDRQGLTPVLAHVERYRQKEQFPRYRDMLLCSGVLFQSNGGAFLRGGTRSWALKQLKTGGIHFLGSDCHNMTTRAPNLGEAAKVIEKKLGVGILEEIEAFSAQALNL